LGDGDDDKRDVPSPVSRGVVNWSWSWSCELGI